MLAARHLARGKSILKRGVECGPFPTGGQLAPQFTQGQIGVQSISLAARPASAASVLSMRSRNEAPWKSASSEGG